MLKLRRHNSSTSFVALSGRWFRSGPRPGTLRQSHEGVFAGVDEEPDLDPRRNSSDRPASRTLALGDAAGAGASAAAAAAAAATVHHERRRLPILWHRQLA